MEIVQLPPLKFVEGYPFEWTLTWSDEATGNPVDFTETVDGVGWSASFTIAKSLSAVPDYTAAPVLNDVGEIYISMAASDFTFLEPPDRIGGDVVAVFQIVVTAPIPQMSQVFQGNVMIAGII